MKPPVKYKRRYKLPGGGYLQKRGGQAQSGAVKAYGSWDVAFPLSRYGDQVAGQQRRSGVHDRSGIPTPPGHRDGSQPEHGRLKHCMRFGTTPRARSPMTLWGSLAVQPLVTATALPPPVVGTVTEATDDHRATNCDDRRQQRPYRRHCDPGA